MVVDEFGEVGVAALEFGELGFFHEKDGGRSGSEGFPDVLEEIEL